MQRSRLNYSLYTNTLKSRKCIKKNNAPITRFTSVLSTSACYSTPLVKSLIHKHKNKTKQQRQTSMKNKGPPKLIKTSLTNTIFINGHKLSGVRKRRRKKGMRKEIKLSECTWRTGYGLEITEEIKAASSIYRVQVFKVFKHTCVKRYQVLFTKHVNT